MTLSSMRGNLTCRHSSRLFISLQKKEKKSPLHLHNVEQHDGGNPGFSMKVTGVFGGDATKRQVREAVVIQQTPMSKLMNRRDEWRQVKLPRIELSVT